MADSASIIIADDHPLFRAALKGMLENNALIGSIHQAEDLTSLQNCVEEHSNAD